MRTLRIGSKRQVFVPRDLGRKLKWEPGTELNAVERAECVEVSIRSGKESRGHRLVLGERLQFTFPIELSRLLGIVESSELRLKASSHRLLLLPVQQKRQLARADARILANEFDQIKQADLMPRVSGLAGLSAVWKSRRKRRQRRS